MAWTQVLSWASFSGRYGQGCAALGTEVVMMGGNGYSGMLSDVWMSADMGSSWTAQASGPERMWFGIAVFLSKLWVVGGTGSSMFGDVWCSSTALSSWSQANASAFSSGLYAMGLTVLHDRMWVAGGYGSASQNEVYFGTGRRWDDESERVSCGH